MRQNPRTTIILLTAGCFLAFFVFGFTDNLKGPTLPAMLQELQISYGMGGNMTPSAFASDFRSTLYLRF